MNTFENQNNENETIENDEMFKNFYITSKGYKIPLNHPKVNELKKELFVQPYCENPVRFPIFRISDKFLYIPKYYGINKFGLPNIENIKEQNGLSVDINFISKLRDYQLEICYKILSYLKKKQSGLVSVYTGWGKTCAALWIASELKLKTLIIVHTENLLQQWKERINDFLGITNDEIGVIQGPKVDIHNKKICIGMIQSISMKDYPVGTFKEFGLTLYDECFPPDTYIHTNIGKKTISDLYKIWKNSKNGKDQQNNLQILSFNKNTNEFEYKPLTYAWQKENSELIVLKLSKYKIKCTLNHKILTPNGYIEADKLSINDIILAKYDVNHQDNIICPAINTDQLQLVYGSYLGDGNLSITKKNRFRLRFIHCEKQKNYLQWKANMFNINTIKYLEHNGYSQKSAYTFCTKCFDLIDFDYFNTKKSTDKYLPNKILNEIDERGLAIWFMDDGSVHKNTVNIHSNSFSYDTHLKFVELFKKFGIECNISKSRKYYYLKFDIINSQKFINIIYKYIHSDLLYKVKTKNIEFFNQKLEKYKWNNDFLNYGTLIVTSKEYIKNKSKFVYDIEVADNHNFVLAKKTYKSQSEYCDGPIVSNCHHTPGRIFSKIFYKIGTKYNLGLSATLTRSDGLTKVIKYFLGETIVSLKLSILNPTIIVKFTNIDPLEEKRMVNGKANIPGMINDLCDSFARNLEIVNLIKDKYNEGRKILVLSDRRNHCNELKRLLETTIPNSENEVGLYYGGMKNAALQESNKKRIIIATYQIASEGYDNKELDTLVFSTPKSNIEQAIGRILRQENEHEPEVIDFVDAWSVFNNLYFSRSRFYKKKKYNISGDIKRNENDQQNIKLDKCVIMDEE